ncbi:MAG: hypothetical protein N2690_00220 [Rhodocyclaceae bacterium]|nr:hypothetical protein [Rhodocyclaceae bacterium]
MEVALRHEVTPQQATLTAGGAASFMMRVQPKGAAPSKMSWSIVPAEANADAGGSPILSNADCKIAQVAAAVREGFYGDGACEVVVTLPSSMRSGQWDLISVAEGAGATSTKKVRLQVQAASVALRLVTPQGQVPASVRRLVSLSAALQTDPGLVYSDVRYQWSADEGNPSKPVLLGANTQQLQFMPEQPGQYVFRVRVSGNINGQPAEATQLVLVTVDPQYAPERVELPDFIVSQPGGAIQLSANVSEQAQGYTYAYRWEQNDRSGLDIPLSGAQTLRATALMPARAGLYAFDFVLQRTSPYGVKSESRYRVHVLVGSSAVRVAITTEGSTVGRPIKMTASLPNVAGLSARYEWKQTGGPKPVNMINANDPQATFVAPEAGLYEFELTVVARDVTGSEVQTVQKVFVLVKEQSGS